MKRYFTLAILLILASCEADPDLLTGDPDSPILISEPWQEDFETGTVSSWFSYPPFQDTAFDFTLIPGWERPQNHLQGYIRSGEYIYPVDLAPPREDGEYYLLRAYRPNSAGEQKIGLAYKKELWAGTGNTRLFFDYWLRYPVDARGELHVQLSGEDGKRYSKRVDSPQRAEWNRADLRLTRFRAEDGSVLEGTTGINAIAVVLELDRGAPSEYVFVALDNVEVNGYQRAGFDLNTPAVNHFTHWTHGFGQKHFAPGEDLSIEAVADVELADVEATLLNLFDEPLIEPVSLDDGENNTWRADNVFTMPQDPLGPITLRLEGHDENGQIARSDIRLWNNRPAQQERPRVLFSGQDREQLMQKISAEPRFADIWNRITSRAERARDENPFPDSVSFADFPEEYLFNTLGTWFDVMRRSTVELIFDNALVWFVDRDPAAREFAIESMMKMAEYDQWMHPWFVHQGRAAYYPIGHAVKSMGLSYDLLYDELTEEQRATIRQGVMENGVIPIWDEYVADNRIPNNTSNWIGMAAGGTLIGLMGFHDELHLDGYDAYGEPWFSTLAEKMLNLSKETMLSDGSYGEGIGYQHITYSHAQGFLAAIDHQFGVSGLADPLHYTNGHMFWLYISLERTHDALAMGDSNPRRGSLDYWSWFAREGDDPLLKWFYAQRPGTGWMALIWDEIDAHEQGTPPEELLPNSMVFPEKGNVVFRSGWEDDDAVFVYRSGPFFNHTHFEQGHFRYHAAGEELITEGRRASYYNDPYFWSYFIQSAAHNTILVDDYAESQYAGDYENEMTGFNDFAHLQDALVSDAGGFLRSELSPVYYSDLETMQRRIWFIDPGYVVIDDHVRSSDQAHTYQMQLHPPHLPKLSIDGDRTARITEGEASLNISVLKPDTPRLIEKRYPLANRDIEVEDLLPRGALQVTHDEPLHEQEFRVVLSPERDGFGMPTSIEQIQGDNYEGVEATFADGRTDRVYFSTGGVMSDRFETDAQTAFVSYNADGDLLAAGFEAATRFDLGDRLSFSAEAASHGLIHLHEEGERIRLSRGLAEQEGAAAQLRSSSLGQARVNTSEPELGSELLTDEQEAGQTRLDVSLSGEPLEIDILSN